MKRDEARKIVQSPTDRVDYSEFIELLKARQVEVMGREKEARNQLDQQIITDPGDMADVSVLDTNADYFLKLANNQQRELVEIHDAIERIHRGVYGTCEICEEPIALDRLKRLPYARLCIDCQSTQERQKRTPRLMSTPKT